MELNFRKCKWLLFGTYHLLFQEDQHCYNNLDKALETYCQYDKILLSSDFSSEVSEIRLDSFLYQYNIRNLVKERTCLKSVSNPSCIDFFDKSSILFPKHPKCCYKYFWLF